MRAIKISYLFILCVIILFSVRETVGQVNFSIASGLRTFMMIGETANNSPIIQRDTNKAQFIGGGLRQINSGFAVMGFLEFGDEGDFVIPFGFEYSELKARERIPISRKTTAYLRNTIIAPTAILGFNYKFYRFPFADVKAFIGIEFDAFFFQSPDFYRMIEYKNLDSTAVYQGKTKTPATRLGGDIKIGFDGNIIKDFSINASIAFGVANLMFRNDARGELLTPTSIDEKRESLIATMRFGLLLKYKL